MILVVYSQSSGVACTPATGLLTGVTASTTQVDSTSLTPCGGPSSSSFCGTLSITESTTPFVFGATAFTSSGATLASGCSTDTVNATALSLSLTMVAAAPIATCGNGVLEPTEQCDPPGSEAGTDAVCDSSCHSLEEALSTGATAPTGPAFFLWPAAASTQGDFLALFTDDVGTTASPHLQAAMRVMTPNLETVASPTFLATEFLAPNDATNASLPPAAVAFDQSQPSAALVLGSTFYVFTDDAAGTPDIAMRSFDSSFDAQQPAASPIVVNGNPTTQGNDDGGTRDGGAASVGEPGQQVAPSVAVNGTGTLFIAWQDVNGPFSGQVVGRTYSPTGGNLGTENPISVSGSNNENVRVAGTATGWVVVWDDTTSIKMRLYAGNGNASGPEIVVSSTAHVGTQDHPAVAVLGDGRSAVVWADHGTSEGVDIFLQRYDANVVAVSGDQASPINDVVGAGDQVTPAIAGTTSAGGAFVAAWVDVPTGDVRGRVLGGTTGFNPNPVDATTDEFKASLAIGSIRENPVVAIGGASQWAAIGWDVAGAVFARRFPTSTE